MKINAVLGAVIGDIIGSSYEFKPTKDYNFELFNPFANFTDDTVLTMSVAKSIIEKSSYEGNLIKFYDSYPNKMYGPGFLSWIDSRINQNSFGNGAPMRISPIACYFNDSEVVLSETRKAVEMTHGHPEGIKGAQAIAMSIFMAKKGHTKNEIKDHIQSFFKYNLNFKINDIKNIYSFDATCQKTVPESIVCFLESTDFESSIRLAISLGGDSDTLACMTGAISAAYYKEIPEDIAKFCLEKLPDDYIELINCFD